MRKMILTVAAVLFLNVSGTYADVMMGIGGTVLFEGDGTVGFSAILPQAGWTSAKRETQRGIATEWDENWRGVPRGIPITTFLGHTIDGFEWSILFDLTAGFSTSFNVSSGLTAEFYFLPVWLGTLGAGIGGGWACIGEKTFTTDHNGKVVSYGAPYIRAAIPFLFGILKAGVYFDYHLADNPYTQLNVFFIVLG